MIHGSDIAPSYAHYPKRADFIGMVEGVDAALKLYRIEKPGEPIAAATIADARAFLAAGNATDAGDHGFVLLHRCGADFHFLLLAVWRGANELWEAVFYRDGGMTDFAPFAPAYAALGAPRPTFCVWELGVVAHEAGAWARLLESPRSAGDRACWRDSVFAGIV